MLLVSLDQGCQFSLVLICNKNGLSHNYNRCVNYMQNLIKGTKSNNQNHFKQNIHYSMSNIVPNKIKPSLDPGTPEGFDFWCLMPLSAISWRPVLVVEASNW
jgi:hypothetical protein